MLVQIIIHCIRVGFVFSETTWTVTSSKPTTLVTVLSTRACDSAPERLAKLKARPTNGR